ncbi:MAG TPA: hypothetical protein VMK16_05260 [Acidimicrobiales bacterium]|nr:hypothetical protein [Acidimicrobiales bacterium]
MAIELVVHDDSIDLTITGTDRWLALSKGIHLPMSEITDARVTDVASLKTELGWRVGGGYWPGRMATGHFTWRNRKGFRQLWAVYADKEVLAIDTTRKNPARIVIQHPGRHDLAWLIGERIPRPDGGESAEIYDHEDETSRD